MNASPDTRALQVGARSGCTPKKVALPLAVETTIDDAVAHPIARSHPARSWFQALARPGMCHSCDIANKRKPPSFTLSGVFFDAVNFGCDIPEYRP